MVCTTAIITEKYDKAYEQTNRQNWTHLLRGIFISVVLGNGLSSPLSELSRYGFNRISTSYTFFKWKRCRYDAATNIFFIPIFPVRVRESNVGFYPLIARYGFVEITSNTTKFPSAFPVNGLAPLWKKGNHKDWPIWKAKFLIWITQKLTNDHVKLHNNVYLIEKI